VDNNLLGSFKKEEYASNTILLEENRKWNQIHIL